MAIKAINFWVSGVITLPEGWANISKDDRTGNPVSLGDGWSIYYGEQNPHNSGSPSSGSPTTGDAAWVFDGAADGGHWDNSNVWRDIVISGPVNTSFNFEVFCSGPSGRIIEMRIGGGSPVVFNTGSNKSATQVFSGATGSDGLALFEWRKHSTSGGATYISAARILPVLSPSVTTTDTLQPGEDFTLTATNFASAPVSPATLTDSQGSTITVPVTISGSGPYTATGTMPTLAEAVTAGTSLLFGDVTIELST